MRNEEITIRNDLRPGDLGRMTTLQGRLYAAEYGYDVTFEAYVAETLAELGRTYRPDRDRVWLAEQGDRLVGCIGIVGRDNSEAQLRWFVLDPAARGRGLGRRLLSDALAFCREAGYRSVYLWTVTGLTISSRLYSNAGFRRTEAKPPAPLWSTTITEERYDLELSDAPFPTETSSGVPANPLPGNG